MKKYKIEHGLVFTDKYCFEPKTLYVAGEKLVTEEAYSVLEGPEELVDASGRYVVPGLTDVHFHGCMGYDCCDGTVEAFRNIAAYEGRQGVTTITPATMTMPEEVLMKVAHAAAAYSAEYEGEGRQPQGAVLAGLYMEGPFICHAKKGAQNGAYIQKVSKALVERLQEASGNKFKTVVVAPETEGTLDFIREMAGQINISLGHTTTDYDTAVKAMEAGACELTHLYNAMPPYNHRNPGPIAAAADFPHCRVELICDGVHIHPAVVRTTFKIFGDDRILMISDSMEAAGLEDGSYELGGQKVIVKGNRAVLESGTLAGSVTNLMGCVRTAVQQMGIPLSSAIKCAAVNPAKAVGIYDRYGSLTPGKYANVVLLNQDIQAEMVFVHGAKLS